MVKVWNYITRMIHDWPLHCFVWLELKTWMRHPAWGLRCFWAESWWMTPEGPAESWYQIWQNFVEGCELSQSHTGHLATTCRVERYGRLWNCILFIYTNYIPMFWRLLRKRSSRSDVIFWGQFWPTRPICCCYVMWLFVFSVVSRPALARL